jgi:signal peptidase
VVLWLLLVGFVSLLVLGRLTPLDILVVRGGSMEPVIHVGSALLIDQRATDLAIGDVASFREPDGTIVTHRVIGVDDDGRFITKGDANAQRDLDTRAEQQIVGIALLSIPLAGYALHILQQPIVFLALLLSTGGYLIFQELRVIWREIARMRGRGANV